MCWCVGLSYVVSSPAQLNYSCENRGSKEVLIVCAPMIDMESERERERYRGSEREKKYCCSPKAQQQIGQFADCCLSFRSVYEYLFYYRLQVSELLRIMYIRISYISYYEIRGIISSHEPAGYMPVQL